MLCRGLPSFDPDGQTLVHQKFKTPLPRIRGVERVSKLGFLWGVRLVEEGGREMVCLVASAGARKAAEEAALEGALISLLEAAYSHWTAEFNRSLAENGEFFHDGVRVTSSGEVSGCGGSGSLAKGRFSHEIDGDVLRLRFLHEAKVGVVEWRPGLARDAAISVLYGLREQRAKASPRKTVSQGTEALRRKAKQRIDAVIRDLAAVLSRGDLASGRAKLQAFCVSHGLQPVGDQFLASAPKLLIQKSFIQKSFEDIQRYHERTMQPQRSADLFEEFVRLGEHDGRLNARQLFALYEIGLFLSYSMPRITAMISAIISGGDTWMAAEAADMAEREREAQRQEYRREADGPQAGARGEGPDGRVPPQGDGFEDFDRIGAQPPVVPAALVPMLAVLGLTAVSDERALRNAWTAKVRQCHPDRLGPGASSEELDEANQTTAEANMAYAVVLEFLRSRS
ncbi:J domain-containing protein [Pararhizobium sp. BT-229]|uniref:J domain-containing protein n=1 Tax=Pararhizobium sp. BT-229 TaxID=2986923 RepID=UPI0021F7EC36|nr:J domain-containing protein [Pararhizobium sp. BT-229]MCV9964572.1 J domain-containing protein [Pararhizobium sp. BT-229]